MTLLLAATMMFLLPLGFLALVAAAAGFFCARLQPIILAAMAWGVGRFCAGLAAGEVFAPMLVPPLLLAFAFAVLTTDAIAKLRLGPLARLGMLAGAAVAVALILGSGHWDGLSILKEYATNADKFWREGRQHILLAVS